MNSISRFVSLSLLAMTATALDGQKLIPAGSLIHCRVSEKISSRVTDAGDPIVCDLNRSDFPHGSRIIGAFKEFKDPGHFVGKGWMQFVFDRVLLPSDQIVPLSLKVVEGPGYRVDSDGHILGKGHATRDAVEWFLPILWPIDVINLPRRGPRPVIKPETLLTLKVMEDVELPLAPEVSSNVYYEPEPQGSYAPEPEPQGERSADDFTPRPVEAVSTQGYLGVQPVPTRPYVYPNRRVAPAQTHIQRQHASQVPLGSTGLRSTGRRR